MAGVCPGPAIVTGGQLAVSALKGTDVSREATAWGAYAVNMGLGMVAARAVEKIIA